MASLLYVFIWSDLVPTSPWGKLHPVSTAVLIVTVLSTRTHSVLKTHSSFHSCFPWLYVNCFQSPWFQCIVIESGGIRCEGCMFLKKAGTSRRGDEKETGGLIHLSALCKIFENSNKTVFFCCTWKRRQRSQQAKKEQLANEEFCTPPTWDLLFVGMSLQWLFLFLLFVWVIFQVFFAPVSIFFEMKWTQTSKRFHFVWKSHFNAHSVLYLCSNQWRQNETQSSTDFIPAIWQKWNFKLAWDFYVNKIYPKRNE